MQDKKNTTAHEFIGPIFFIFVQLLEFFGPEIGWSPIFGPLVLEVWSHNNLLQVEVMRSYP